jgi:predicted RNA-binding Zn ribbon-like protein
MYAAVTMRQMSTTAAPGESARPALALVNSRRHGPGGDPIDELASPAALRAWLADHGLPAGARIDRAGLATMRELRDAVRELLLARIDGRLPDPAAIEAVNAASTAARTACRLEWTDPAAPLEVHDRFGAAGAALAGALLAADAIDLVTGPGHAELQACAAPGCMRLLLRDHPRRQWCSTRCGDRVRARRYYRRRRDARAS